IDCDGAPCSSAWYARPVSIALAATDGGSGVDRIVYTTDGSDPLTSGSAQTYSAPFTVDSATTVEFSATDRVGNVESVATRQVNVDLVAPTAELQDPGADVSGVVTLTSDVADDASGIDHVVYAYKASGDSSWSTTPA